MSSFNKITVTNYSYIKLHKYPKIMLSQLEQVKMQFTDLLNTVVFIITTPMRVNHSLLRVSLGGCLAL